MKAIAAFAVIGIAALPFLQGCAVGPDFRPPAAPKVARYTAMPLTTTVGTPDVPGGGAQRFVVARDIPGEWWTLFRSRSLNELVKRALKNNPDLKAAQAALSAARETVLAQEGAYYPGAAGSVSASRQKTSAQLSPTPNSGALYFSLYTPQVNVSYVPDIFGLNRRTVEYLGAQADQARFALIATQITLTSNIVVAALQEASVRAQIGAARKLVVINTEILKILRNQYSKGYASRLDVATQQAQLAQAIATLPPLLKQLAQQRDLLVALCGGYPDQNMAETFTLSELQLPDRLPVSVPSALVEQRPDIKMAEANLHAASAQVGIAVANRLPNITLTASAGTAALSTGQIFAGGAGFWSLGASLTQPLFDGGALLHKEGAARDAYIQAAAQYHSTVIAAFQNVADTLNALEQDARTLKSTAEAANDAKTAFDLVKQQMMAGYASNIALANAEIIYQQASINLVQAEANRYADTAALFLALGGGWRHASGASLISADLQPR